MANAQIGISCFERNGFLSSYHISKFLSPLRPTSGIGLTVMDAHKIRSFGLKVVSSGVADTLSRRERDSTGLSKGNPLQQEFEFKPSFDEYLSAMESIKTGRDKKKSDSSNKWKVTDNRTRTAGSRPFSEANKKNLKSGEFEIKPDGERVFEVVKQRWLSENEVFKVVKKKEFLENAEGDGGRRGVSKSRLDNKVKRDASSKDKFNEKESVEAKVKSKDGETRKGKWSLDKSTNVKSDWKGSHLAERRKVQKLAGAAVLDASSTGMVYKSWAGHSQKDYNAKVKAIRGNTIGAKRSEMDTRRIHTVAENVTDMKIGQKHLGLSRHEKTTRQGLEVESAAFKNFDEFNDVMDKPRVSKMEMEERIQRLAKWLNGAPIDMPEWMFAKTMRSAKIRYSDHSVLRVIQILGKLGNWRRVLQVIEWLQMHERFKSHKLRFIYTTALDVLGKARRPVEALNVFHAMQQKFSTYPDLVAYHSIAVTLGQAGHMRELFDVIDSMRSPPKKKFKTAVFEKWDPRLEPDIAIYNAVLNACVQRKQWEGAFWVLQQLKQQCQQPSTTTYGLVMEVMFACGKYNLVHEFFRKLQKSSIPNCLTYKVVVNTLWREGKIDEALQSVLDMERRGIVGSAALYYDLARCLCSSGRCQEGLMQIEKICRVANKPLVVTYTGLIQACLESGNIESGVYIFKQMEDVCAPNLVTFNIMLKAYLENKMFKEAKELFQRMSENGHHINQKYDYESRVIPDVYTFNTMLDTFFSEKMWDDFQFVYEDMLHNGYQFNAKRHLRMILAASRAGKEELLETVWNHLAQVDRIPAPPLIKERFCIKLEKGDYSAALSSIASFQSSDSHVFSKLSWLNLLNENASRFRNDTIFRLIEEVDILTAKIESYSLSPVLQNLLCASKEFCTINVTVAELKLATVCKPEHETIAI